MEYMTEDVHASNNVKQILCCQCGVVIEPNPANMCVSCLRTEFDITADIPKQATLHFCRSCERYLQPPGEWVLCSLESRELLALCLKKLKGLNRVKLIDASFIWTEPHSKRIKTKLTVQGEVVGGAVLQQVFIVEFIIANQMCDDCHRVEAKDFWKALVQVRQKADNKKTFYYLEQLILKHKAHENTLGIKPIHEGLDFFFATESQARKMVDFLSTVLPCRSQHSKKLLSHDIHSNVYNYKFTYCVELVPISRDSLVCLSKKMCQQLGGIGSVCVVLRVTNAIHLIDPNTAQLAEVKANAYWKSPFYSICNPKQLVEYTVMDVEPIMDKERNFFPGQGPISTKHILADIWLVKTCELGINENTIHTRTHLGHLLKPGDTCMGYCLSDSNVNNDSFDSLDRDKVPDVVIIKKHYGDSSARRRRRQWKLKHLEHDDRQSLGSANMDYCEFLDDLEEDADYRQNINIYLDKSKTIPVDVDDITEPGPCVTLEEMIDELTIEDVEMA